MQKYILISMLAFGLLFLAGCSSLDFSGQKTCPEIEQTVCGVDGQTYTNPCFAHDAGASVAHDGPCAAGTSSTDEEGCSDGDGGKDLFIAATVMGPTGDYQDDYCKDTSSVFEYYCDSGSVAYEVIPCPSGYECISGACSVAPCSDSDGGIKAGEKGTTTSGSESKTDTCEDDSTLLEYFCKEGAIASQAIACAADEECVSGACAEYACDDSDDGEEVGELGVTSKGDASQTDSCYDINTVKEYYCENNQIKSKNMACPSTEECVGGLCVEKAKCIDTDGGEDKFTLGTTSYEDKSYTDDCYSSVTVLEYYCEGEEIKTRTLVCGYGYQCSSGVCVEEDCEPEVLDEEPIIHTLFDADEVVLYKGEAIQIDDGDGYMLKLTSVKNETTAIFSLYETYEDFESGDDICDDLELTVDVDEEDACGEDLGLTLLLVNDSDDFVEIESHERFNVIQHISREGITYSGDGCPDDEIQEETSLFYISLTDEMDGEKFLLLGENTEIEGVDIEEGEFSFKFDGHSLTLKNKETFEFDDLTYEMRLSFSDSGIDQIIVDQD